MFLTSHPSLSICTDTMARTGESGSSTLARAARAASGESLVTVSTASGSPSRSGPARISATSSASVMVAHTRNITGFTAVVPVWVA